MKKFTMLLLFGVSLFSCSTAPHSIDHSFSDQQKLEAAEHWKIIAHDFAKGFAAEMKLWTSSQTSGHFSANNLAPFSGTGHVIPDETAATQTSLFTEPPNVYIQTNDRSLFGKALRSDLINALIANGYQITYSPENAITIRWSVQKITHQAKREMNTIPGTYTALAAIGAGVYKVFDSSSAYWGALAAGAALDIIDQAGRSTFSHEAPHSELNLTFSVSKDGVLLARNADTYYVNSEDTWHYNNIPDFEGQEEARLPGKSFIVVNH